MRVGTVGMPAIQAETVEFLTEDETGTVKAGATEVTNIKAPSGYIYEVIGIKMSVVRPDVTSTTGHHGFSVGSEASAIGFGLGYSEDESEVAYDHRKWRVADNLQYPDDGQAEADCFKGIRIDATDGLDITYTNQTDKDQANARTIRLCVRKLKVAT